MGTPFIRNSAANKKAGGKPTGKTFQGVRMYAPPAKTSNAKKVVKKSLPKKETLASPIKKEKSVIPTKGLKRTESRARATILTNPTGSDSGKLG